MYEKVIKVFAMRCDEKHSYRGRIEEIENYKSGRILILCLIEQQK